MIRFVAILSLFSVLFAAQVPALPFVARECWSGTKDCSQDFQLSGQLIFKNRSPNKTDCMGLSSILFFKPDAMSRRLLSSVLFYGGDLIKVNISGDDELYQALEQQLPLWYKEGLLGEVQFFVKGNFYGFMPAGDACDGGWIYEIKARNIELHDKVNESLSDKSDYSHIYGDTHFAYERILLNNNQTPLKLHRTPKGEVIATILPQAQNYGFLYRLDGDYSNHWGQEGYPIDFGVSAALKDNGQTPAGWVKVIFFPPNETSGSKALVGYILASAIRATVMSLDIIHEDPVIIPPSLEFQQVPRPADTDKTDYVPPTDMPLRTIKTPY